MTEPDVTLTDYGLALLCAVLAWIIARRGSRKSPLRMPFTVFFAAIGATSLLGGTVHGFFLDETSAGHALLWPATMLGVGITALSAWILGARLQFSPKIARRIAVGATAAFVLYAWAVLFVTADFSVGVASYLPAVLFLFVIYGLRFARRSEGAVLIGFCGLFLTFLAAAVQQGKIALHPLYFNHNALYHLLQAIALFMIFLSARHLCARESAPGR